MLVLCTVSIRRESDESDECSARPANWVWENIELQFWPKLIIEPFLQCGFKGLHVGPKVPPMLSACATL